jgi:hypothetical protein
MHVDKFILSSYVTTIDMKADILTKIMLGPKFVRLRSLIGINAPRYHEGKIRGGVRQDSLIFDCLIAIEMDCSFVLNYLITTCIRNFSYWLEYS